jgi:TPR repeat protein
LTRAQKGDGAALHEISQKYKFYDQQLAMKWCRLSAEKNYGEAQYDLGVYSHTGIFGLAQNQFIAMEWYLRAASQKKFLAYEKIAELFEYGEKGIMTDDKKSLEWHYRWNPNSEQVKMLQKEGYTLTKAERGKSKAIQLYSIFV